MSQSFAPQESAADIWLERSNFAGGELEGVAYGVHLCVFFATMYFAHKFKGKTAVSFYFLGLVVFLFALGTFQIGGNTKFNEMMWIDDRNIPGGPDAWVAEHYDNPVNTFQNVAYIIANFLADGSMIYRLFVIWDNNYLVIVVPFLAYLASTALSILTVFQSAQPGANLWTHTTVQFAVPYWSLTIGLNILISLLIAFRLLRTRKMVSAALGAHHAKSYTSAAAIIIESASLYSITGLIFIICYARDSNVQNIVLPVLDQVVCIAPELIVFRLILGQAWTQKTTTQLRSAMELDLLGGRTNVDEVTQDNNETSSRTSGKTIDKETKSNLDMIV